ncbi:MAG TPA: hypothetical protein VHL60_13265 [Oxalicibacterium sp.]|nr:hypothetical protein [Oxalicibacterium sp.]
MRAVQVGAAKARQFVRASIPGGNEAMTTEAHTALVEKLGVQIGHILPPFFVILSMRPFKL